MQILTHYIHAIFWQFFIKTFYGFFIFYVFTKFYFSLTSRWKLEYTTMYTTVFYAICFKKSIKKWSKFWSKNYRFFSEVQIEIFNLYSPWLKLSKIVKFSTFLLSGWHFFSIFFSYFLLKIFCHIFLKIGFILRNTIGDIFEKIVKILAKI